MKEAAILELSPVPLLCCVPPYSFIIFWQVFPSFAIYRGSECFSPLVSNYSHDHAGDMDVMPYACEK